MDDLRSDDEIAARLRDALEAEGAGHGPDAARVEALRRVAHARRQVDSLERRRPRRLPRRVGAYGLVAAAAVLAFVAGALVTARPPDAVRDAAGAIGFDVDSSDLVDARARMDELGRTLAQATTSRVEGDVTPGQLAAVAQADARMLDAIGSLEPAERDELVPIAHQVHLRAVELFVAEGETLATAKPTDLAEIDRGT